MSILELALIIVAATGTIATAPAPAGPTNTGRIGGITVDPSDPSGNSVYVGSANGGVWKTTNGGV